MGPKKNTSDFPVLNFEELKQKKELLLNLSISSLINQPKPTPDNELFNQIVSECKIVARHDPEFVLKLSLYMRTDLNIRSVSNYLVALASYIKECHPYVRKYFCYIVNLPSDWLEVVEYYHTLCGSRKVSYPSCLRKGLIDKFNQFDEYQLGKYNNEKVLKKKRQLNQDVKYKFTFKELIRKLHISKPHDHVMCILGKKYPSSIEEFKKSNLPGHFEEWKAGKRMKLPVPETWERLLSVKGNVAKTWEELMDHKKLPFMAMLRNLRNIILTGVNHKYHDDILKKLTDPKTIAHSRQFPFSFYNAYNVIPKDMNHFYTLLCPNTKNKRKPFVPLHLPTQELFDKYRQALDTSIKLATLHNIMPIKGSTLVLLQGHADLKPNTLNQMYLLGLMCKFACENCVLKLYGGSFPSQGNVIDVELLSGTILENMEQIKSQISRVPSGKIFPLDFLESLIADNVKFDNIIVLNDGIEEKSQVSECLNKYRAEVNPDLLYVSINVGKVTSTKVETSDHPNNVNIVGFSDQILRFIVERGQNTQLQYIESIDTIKGIKNISKVNHVHTSPWWNWTSSLVPKKIMSDYTRTGITRREAKVFISSTFLDMQKERDTLMRIIFPELKAIFKNRRVNITEIDLRWGITEEEASSGKNILLCLKEVLRSNYLIGILGSRYGYVPESYNVEDDKDLEWLKEYPNGRSITELEIALALRVMKEKSYFYIRDKSVLKKIPANVRELFEETDPVKKKHLLNLKRTIVNSTSNVFVKYPSKWGRMEGDIPMLDGIDAFSQRVFDDLYNVIDKDFPVIEDPTFTDPLLIENENFIEEKIRDFVGRKEHLKLLRDFARNHFNNKNLFLLVGNSGEGKSALLAKFVRTFYNSYNNYLIIPHFCSTGEGSRNIKTLLSRIIKIIVHELQFNDEIPLQYDELIQKFYEVIRRASFQQRIIIVIDGLEELDNSVENAHNLLWLQENLPCKFIISTSSDILIQRIKSKKFPSIIEVRMTPLPMKDGAQLVRRILSRYHKKLSETSSNNQMRMLLKKKDATKPLYIVIACEQLRTFGSYDHLTEEISNIGSTITSLFDSILMRLESFFGEEIISKLFTTIAVMRNGLLESEAIKILGVDAKRWKELYRAICPFILPSNKRKISFSYSQMYEAVHKRYFITKNNEIEVHESISEFFINERDNERKYSELPYHLFNCRKYDYLEDLLTDLKFIENKCKFGLGNSLIEDFIRAKSVINSQKLDEFYTFLSNQISVFEKNPNLVLQQALNEPDKTYPHIIAQQCIESSLGSPIKLIKWENKPIQESSCRMTLSGAGESITAVSVSKNNKLLAYATEDLTIRVVELETRNIVVSFKDHSNTISSLCFSNDSKYLLSGSWDKTIIMYDLSLHAKVFTLTNHTKQVSCVCFNSDDSLIASSSWDMTVKIWDIEGELKRSIKSHDRPINSCTFINDDKHIMSASWNGKIHIHDVYTGELIRKFETDEVSISSVTESSKYILSGMRDGRVLLFNKKNGEFISEINRHFDSVNKVSFTKDEKYVISCSDDSTLRMVHSNLGVETFKVTTRDSITAIGFHPNNSFLIVAGSSNCKLYVWDLLQKKKVLKLKGHNLKINCVIYSPCGSYIASCSDENIALIWDSKTGSLVRKLEGHQAGINSLTFSKDDKKYIVTCSDDSTIIVWNYITGEKIKVLRGHTNSVTGVTMSKNGLIYSVSKDNTIRIWSVDKGLLNVMKAHKDWITSVECSTFGVKLVTSSYDNSIIKHNLKNGKQDVLAEHKSPTIRAKFSHCNNYIVSASTDNEVIVWNANNNTLITSLYSDNGRINDISISSDNKIAAGFDDGTIKVWNPLEPHPVGVSGHTSKINDFIVLEDNSGVVSASHDSTIKVWNVAKKQTKNENLLFSTPSSSDDEVQTSFMLNAHNSKINDISFTNDFTHILTASNDRTCCYWDYVSSQKIRSYSHNTNKPIRSCRFYNQDIFLTACSGGNVLLWDRRENSQLDQILTHQSAISCMDVIENDNIIVTGGWDKALKIWDFRNLKNELKKIYATDWITSCHLNSSMSSLVFGTWNGIVGTVDYKTGNTKYIFDKLSNITDCKFSSNGKVISVADSSDSVYFYSVKTTRKGLLKLNDKKVKKLHFANLKDSNSRDFITASDDRMIECYTDRFECFAKFPLLSECSSLKYYNSESQNSKIVVGDITGTVYILNYE